MDKISAIVITLNEEHNIHDCLKSLEFTDEIIIIDSESTDNTAAIAKTFTSKIYTGKWDSYADKREFGISKTANDWILILDADEKIEEELRNEILTLKPSVKESYFVNRKNYYLGKWIKHGGFYPDYQLRLFRKDKVRLNKRIVHEG